MKIRPVGAELFHVERTDRQTDITKLRVAFRNVANGPKTKSITHEEKQNIKAGAGINILKLKRLPMLKGSTQQAGLHFSANQEQ